MSTTPKTFSPEPSAADIAQSSSLTALGFDPAKYTDGPEEAALSGEVVKAPLTGEIIGASEPAEARELWEYETVPHPERHEKAAKLSPDVFGLGQRLALHFSDYIAHVEGADDFSWYVYNRERCVWVSDPSMNLVKDAARIVIASLAGELEYVGTEIPAVTDLLEQLAIAEMMPDSRERSDALSKLESEIASARSEALSNHLKFISRARDYSSYIDGAVSNASGLLRKRFEVFDADPHSINTPEGLLNLETLTVQPSSPLHYCTKVTEVSYRPGAEHKDLTAVIERLDDAGHQGLSHFVQRYLGTACTGLPAAKTFFYLDGVPDSAKSTLLEKAALALSNDDKTGYAAVVEPHVFVYGKADSNAADTKLHSLQGRRYTFSDEADRAGTLSDIFKKYVSGELLQTRAMREMAVSWRPHATLAMAGNGMIGIPTDDAGVLRRFVGAHLSKPVENLDPKLRGRLGSKEGLEALFAWMVKGANEWLAEGATREALGITDEMVRLTSNYVSESDNLEDFFEEYLEVVDPDSKDYLPLRVTAWKALYKRWANVNVGRAVFDSNVNKRLKALGEMSAPTTRTHGGYISKGRLLLGVKLVGDSYETLVNLNHVTRDKTGSKHGGW